MTYTVWLYFHEYEHTYSFPDYDAAMQFVGAAKRILFLEWLEVTNDGQDENFYVWHAT